MYSSLQLTVPFFTFAVAFATLVISR